MSLQLIECPPAIHRFGVFEKDMSHLQALLWFTPVLIESAVKYAKFLDGHYDRFNVGNASLAVAPNGEYLRVLGANYKAHEEAAKVCAERLTVYRAEQNVFSILSFHVVAPHRSEMVVGNLETPTIQPCGICRDGDHTMEHDVVSPHAAVVTHKRGTNDYQAIDRAELTAGHALGSLAGPVGQVIHDPGLHGLRRARTCYDEHWDGYLMNSPNSPAMDLRSLWVQNL